MVSALMSIPLLIAAASAVEYTSALRVRSHLQNALDLAAMDAAVVFKQTGIANDAVARGISSFQAHCPSKACANPTIVVVPGFKVTASYTENFEPQLLRFSNAVKVPLGVLSEVKLSVLNQEYHMLVDRSASLGFGADPTNVSKLMALTKTAFNKPGYSGWKAPDGCAFACHEPIGLEPVVNGKCISTYTWAQNNGIKLREDVLLKAVHDASDHLLAPVPGGTTGTLKVAAYVFSDTVQKIVSLTSTPTDITAKVEASTVREWGTRYDLIFPTMKTMIGKGGTGATVSDPLKTLVLITDGVWTNYNDDSDSIYWTKNFDDKWCTDLKNYGIRIVVIDVQYPKLYTNYWFKDLVLAFEKDISPELEQCATPGNYYHAEDSAQIAAALDQMVTAAKSAKLHFIR